MAMPFLLEGSMPLSVFARMGLSPLVLLTALLFRPPIATTDDDLTHARRLHSEAIGIDSHIDTVLRVLNRQ